MSLADAARAIRPSGVWEAHFAPWAGNTSELAKESAITGLAPLATSFVKERRQALQEERAELHRWLVQRSREITGQAGPAPRQRELFRQGDLEETAASWNQLQDPVERLAAFAADGSQPSVRRSEADGVLRLHSQRLQDLEDRLTLGDPEVVPLGLLMIVPEPATG